MVINLQDRSFDYLMYRGVGHLSYPRRKKSLCGKTSPDQGGYWYRVPWQGDADRVCKKCIWLVKMILEKDADAKRRKEKAWRKKYEQRLIDQGYLDHDAHESAMAAEYADDIDPVEAADDEISYYD
jgi:hypothetical protein